MAFSRETNGIKSLVISDSHEWHRMHSTHRSESSVSTEAINGEHDGLEGGAKRVGGSLVCASRKVKKQGDQGRRGIIRSASESEMLASFSSPNSKAHQKR
ncbi:hypothetical protein TB1_028720 [Malus domestica]